jgi:hypothetical protein
MVDSLQVVDGAVRHAARSRGGKTRREDFF